MRTTQQLSITLPSDMAEAIKAKVRAGAYASESEVIRDGLRALLRRDQAVEAWLHGEVAGAYDALLAQPQRGRTAAELRARLRDAHEQAAGAHAQQPQRPRAA